MSSVALPVWVARFFTSEATTAKELRAFGLRDHFTASYDARADLYHKKHAAIYRQASMHTIAAGLLTGVAIALAYGFIASRGLVGELGPGDITAVIGAFAALTAQIGLLSSALLRIEQHSTFLDDLFAFFTVEPLVDVPEQPVPLPAKLDPGIVLHAQLRHGLSAKEIEAALNHESGLLGVSGVSADMREVLAAQLRAHRLMPEAPSETYSTPRRLTVRIARLAERQTDLEETVTGPPVSASFTPDGAPTPAAVGFATRQGVEVSAL